jgi:transcriptional regulator with XRE-family HTH domain
MKKQEAETMGQRLRRFLTREDMTLATAAAVTGLNIRTVWTIVHERHIPNPRTEYKLMKLMGEVND